MNVSLINFDRDAIDQLLFTKATRLNMTPGLLEEIRAWPVEKKLSDIKYMSRTIPSSWEFVSLTFLVEGLSRSDAQQVTRTRTASFAMQSMRVTDVRDMAIVEPAFLDSNNEYSSKRDHMWQAGVDAARGAYAMLVDDGMPVQDARGVLPIATSCNLVVRYNLRAFADMLKGRESMRTQGPYREMALKMKKLVLEVWPWSEDFFIPAEQQAIAIVEEVIASLGLKIGNGPGWELAKVVDLLRKG